jgi:hypothetical protein
MSQSLTGLLEAMRRALHDDVKPELNTDFARTQIAGVLDILSKFEQMLVWSPDIMHERFDALAAGANSFADRVAAAGYELPPSQNLVLPPNWHQADLETALHASEDRLITLSDWLFDNAPALPQALYSELDSKLRETLRSALMAERRLVPRANFTAMTDTG